MIEAFPDDLDYQLYLGMTKYKQGDREKADEIWRTIREEEPRYFRLIKDFITENP